MADQERGLPYEEYTGVRHEIGSYFQEKIPKKGISIFHKNSERAIITSVRNSRQGQLVFIAQMTNQKKTELIDYFHLVWTKIHNFRNIF